MSQGALQETNVSDKLSLEEWYDLPEDVSGELVDGYLVEEELPSYIHEFLVILLGRIFADWILPRGGLVAASDAKFGVSRHRGRKPDLTVYFPGSPFPAPRGLITTPPDIMIEIVSASPRDGRRDRIDKVKEYAAFDVRYYWIIDPQLRSLEVLELGPHGRYTHALGASTDVLDQIPGCDGLLLDLDSLWSEIARVDPGGADG